MTISQRVDKLIGQAPWVAVVLYPLLVGLFVVVAVSTAIDLNSRRQASSAARDVLQQVEGRGIARRVNVATDDVSVPTGSPFLEGSSVSVAGAALLQRLTGAIVKVGGNILSSQIDLQTLPSKPGYISVTTNSELDSRSLQPLLYDIEAGMPFLFVDQLVVQAPAANAATPNALGGKLRVLMSVSGQWQRAK